MKRHWKEVQKLFEILAYMVKSSDPDGIELHFTISSDTYKEKKTRPLTNVLGTKSYEGQSNVRSSLHDIVEAYKYRLRARSNTKHARWYWGERTIHSKPAQNLYVFTDGIWQPDSDPTEIIADLVDDLKNHSVLKEQFGIQFISFGDDPGGLTTLRRLDSGLNLPMYVDMWIFGFQTVTSTSFG